jgi:hypothetical protein
MPHGWDKSLTFYLTAFTDNGLSYYVHYHSTRYLQHSLRNRHPDITLSFFDPHILASCFLDTLLCISPLFSALSPDISSHLSNFL